MNNFEAGFLQHLDNFLFSIKSHALLYEKFNRIIFVSNSFFQ